jgi:hypothetical protein
MQTRFRGSLLGCLLLTTCAWGATNQIPVGKLIYLGGSTNQYGNLSQFEVQLNAQVPITFADVTMTAETCEKPSGPCASASQDLQGQGPTTSPAEWTYYGGTDGNGFTYILPSCTAYGCSSICAQLLSDGKTITLLNGEAFKPQMTATACLQPAPGQHVIKAGQKCAVIPEKESTMRDALAKLFLVVCLGAIVFLLVSQLIGGSMMLRHEPAALDEAFR